MDSNVNLLAETSSAKWSFEKTTPFPATQGFYRSRIYTSDIGINPLIAACDQLFGLVAILKNVEYPENRDIFFQDLAHEIRSFEHRAQLAGYLSNTIIAARYALCSLLDEAIAITPWGQTQRWHEKSLLALFHNENYGGARFFSIIDRALENISNNLHLIELLYLCLNFGFTGKYREMTNGQNELLSIINRLYQIIGQYNSGNQKNILIQDEKTLVLPEEIIPKTESYDFTAPIVNTKKLFLGTIGFAIIISTLIFLGFNLKLNHMSEPIYAALKQAPAAQIGGKT